MKPLDEIIISFNRRDPEAFSRIFSELYPAVYLFVAKLIYPDPAGKDLTADAFLRLWEHEGGFENLASLRSFVFQTAKNLALDYLRRVRTERKKLQEIQKLDRELLTGRFQPAESHSELMIRISRAIDYLPRQCRHVFVLYYMNGLTNSEIANRLSISVKTVSNQKAIALKMLKIRLTRMRGLSVPLLFAALSHLVSLQHFLKP